MRSTGCFSLPVTAGLEFLADVNAEAATRAAATLGFARATGSWRELVADPAVDIVAITTPNTLHCEMALAALAAGKHVYCEKPLAPTVDEARAMTQAAERAGVVTAVGFNYLKNPMLKLARAIIASGDIGEVRTFQGIHSEDFMADASQPWTWRLDPAGGGGALADIGSHIIATARYLVGPIERVLGDVVTAIAARPCFGTRTVTHTHTRKQMTFKTISLIASLSLSVVGCASESSSGRPADQADRTSANDGVYHPHTDSTGQYAPAAPETAKPRPQ